ncbi:hypothetical protein [Mesorhizobium sp. CN2-181]|uniref:hypothetical protein n=1 Tax=Mesorhizobium yinganensis TaxID=3157707 RepID=UPI0032B84452
MIPKDESIEIAAGNALAEIYHAARAFPDDSPQWTSFNDVIRELSRDDHPARLLPESLAPMVEFGNGKAEEATA